MAWLLLLHCKREIQCDTRSRGCDGEPPVVDLRRPPLAAPPVPWLDTDIVPARPSTEEERQNYWRAQEAKDVVMCEQAGPRLRSQCIAEVARLEADSSLCNRIEEAHRWERSHCYRYVAEELGDVGLCSKVADEPIRSLCEEADRLRPFDLTWACQSEPGESMRAACERDVQSKARPERLEKEYWALVQEYSLPHCEALRGGHFRQDYFVRDKDECYRRERAAGNHMACLHESGGGELGQRIAYIARCEALGSARKIELIGFRRSGLVTALPMLDVQG